MSSVNRRQALSVLAGGVWAARRGSGQSPLHFTALDHIEFFASDVMQSVAFYAGVFGNTVLKNNKATRRYVKLGSSYMAIEKVGETAGQAGVRVDHFCAGIEGFKVADVHSFLMERGIEYKDYPSGRDLAVTDPDGTRLQLASDNGWNLLLGGTASPEAISAGDPIFRPIGLEHVLLNVSDPEKAAEFFAKILGPVTERDKNRIWFRVGASRVGLLKTPEGGLAGVNRYCVEVERFDYADVAKKLEGAGAKVQTPEISGAAEFYDRDGYLLQVTARP